MAKTMILLSKMSQNFTQPRCEWPSLPLTWNFVYNLPIYVSSFPQISAWYMQLEIFADKWHQLREYVHFHTMLE